MRPAASPTQAINWLLTEGPRQQTPGDMLEGFCLRLRADNVPIDRATIGAPLLHPIAQSSYARWNLGEPAENNWFIWSDGNEAIFSRSPIRPIYREGVGHRLKLDDPADRDKFAIGADLAAEGFAEYSAIALPFPDGTFKAFTAATRQSGGFTDAEHDIIAACVPALTIVLDGFIQRKTARTLLDTYIGRRAASRVMQGEIKRGDGSEIEAVIFFSDVRGFTGLAHHHTPASLIERLNFYFQALVDAVADQGGETLKFIGDSVLAIFPLDDDLAATVERAERAAFSLMEARKTPDWPADVEFGIALHCGPVFYGNIGGETRLDFTVIGEAVNIANRIEGLCGLSGHRFLVSGPVAAASQREYEMLGDFDLKGVERRTQVFRRASGGI